MKVIILPIHKHKIFNDAAKVIEQLPGDDTICIGIHDWTLKDIETIRHQTPTKIIAYQTELLYSTGTPFRNTEYIEKLKLFDEIWDYSEHNIPFLERMGIRNIKYVPVLPSEILRDAPMVKDIDVFHFGAFTRHRVDLINRIIREGFDITDALLTFKKALHDDELHNIIRRSKVIIGTHSHPQCPIQEAFRYQYPLSNDIPVLGEKSLTNTLNIDEFNDEDEMIEKLKHYVSPKFAPNHIHKEMLQLCVYYTDYIQEAKYNLDNPDIKTITGYALDAIDKDRNTINAIREYPERSLDIAECEWMIFHSLIQLWTMVQKNRSQFTKGEYFETQQKIHDLYKATPRNLLNSRYKSQEGSVMPWIRRLLLLHGWFICKTSLNILSAINYERKLIGNPLISRE